MAIAIIDSIFVLLVTAVALAIKLGSVAAIAVLNCFGFTAKVEVKVVDLGFPFPFVEVLVVHFLRLIVNLFIKLFFLFVLIFLHFFDDFIIRLPFFNYEI